MSAGDTSTTTAAQRRSWWFATIGVGAAAIGSVWLLVWRDEAASRVIEGLRA